MQSLEIFSPIWIFTLCAVLFAAFLRGLAGFGFAAAYYFGRWNLGRVLPDRLAIPRDVLRRGPKLRVHAPDDYYRNLDEEADRILDKVHRSGQESLTPKERRTLENYSRRMRQKHR